MTDPNANITITIDENDLDDSDVQYLGSKREIDVECVLIREKSVNKRPKTTHNKNQPNTANPNNTQRENVEPPPLPSTCVPCSVCFENSRETKEHFFSTICGHIYCERCLKKIMEIPKQANCSICRKKLTKKAYHRIFLS